MKPEKPVKTVVGSGGGSVVQGSRTAVMVGGGEVDLDRVAASISEQSRDQRDNVSVSSQPGAKQFGRSLAGAITGAAANFKSRLANMSSVTAPLVARSSPSPPDTASSGRSDHVSGHRTSSAKVREVPIRVEQSGGGNSNVSPQVLPLTVPGAADYGENQHQRYLETISMCFRIFSKI